MSFYFRQKILGIIGIIFFSFITVTTIFVDKVDTEGKVTTNSFNLLPRGVNSLKVLQDLPIILVLMYQIYKQNVHQEVVEFVPLIMTTITLQPSSSHRAMSNFNREVFVDFMGAQIKALSFLAYIIRTFLAQFQETINAHAPTMVEGMISLLRLCPIGPASLRKELLVATRHILATELRNKFINSIDLLFDEDLLLGRGYTSHESLRPLAYSTLADLVHHVRQQLKLDILTKAVYLFSKNVHDESLPTSIQTMSCKLLLNLVDCIRVQRNDDSFSSPTPRELLMTMLKVFTLKFHTIAKLQLPLIMQKWKNLSSQPQASTVDISKEMIGIDISPETMGKLTSIGFSPPNTLNVCEYRSLVKTLICGVKTITYGINLTDNPPQKMPQPVTFQPDEVLIFIDLFNWALEALDIYMINIPTPGMPTNNKPITQMPRSKDEKELLEHFSGLFLTMSAQNFQEIFSSTIDFMVDRIAQNVALQVIANSFLASPTTSPLFATVLIEYLLERMEEMGSNIDRSNLYLRLFKLVFGSVSLFANENEQMLRPHLHSIVNRSMELAMTAKEPYNYFLLLRALFRSIGGGSHDKLYKEFLPLLPNLLEGLNRLQSGFHKQHMKDLFVELCLTVPVRLSSLLPYLPMLMDPLVSALNGSPTLVNQGLRTLELCVDNLQPDFLYDHIQPVRADLMQALWRTLRNTDSAALVAFRVLGKFGGGNRKMMIEPQQLEYNIKDTPSPAVVAYFQEQRKPIDFPVDKVIETAFIALKTSSTDPFYWAQSWEVIRCYLAASITLNDEKHMLQKLFTHPSFTESNIPNTSITPSHFQENQARKTHQTALTAMFVAAATKELRQSVLPTVIDIVRHYTMVAIAQQAGPFPLKHNQSYNSLDPLVLIDALAAIMGHEEKELCKAANFAMVLILKTATDVMGTKERACRLPIMQYLAEKMSNLCYERPWYAKMGGCIALKFLYEHMSMRWLYQHLYTFLKAYLFVIMDLTGEVSSGAIDMAKSYLENMLNICMTPLDKECKNEELMTIQRKAMYDVTHELVRRITSPHTLVRETAMSSLRQIARLQNNTVTEVMLPHKGILEDIVPPKKHLLKHQPAGAQIGLMDANTFCTTLEPKLFTLDISIVQHKFFFHEVVTLAEVDDVFLSKLDCFKNITNLIPLRKSALRALAACHYLGQDRKSIREKIFTILFKALEKNSELQETAFECMQKFNLGSAAEKESLLQNIRPLLTALGDHRSLTINIVKRLSYLTQLFPSMFNEKFCDQLLEIIKKMLQASVTANKSQNFLKVSKTGETEMKIATIIEIFHQIPAATQKYVPTLIAPILAAEKDIMIEPSSPYRAPLVKFLIRYPEETIDMFLSESNIKNKQYNRFLIYLLKHKEGTAFKSIMENREDRLVELVLKDKTNHNTSIPEYNSEEENEAQHEGVLIVHTLVVLNDKWLPTKIKLVNALNIIWSRELGSCGVHENITCDLWHLVAKILLHYFENNPSNINLLYDLLKVFCMRFIPDFQVSFIFFTIQLN